MSIGTRRGYMWSMMLRVWFITSLMLGIASCASPEEVQPYSLQFAAVVGEGEFACGQPFSDLGITDETLTVSDLRFYVHDIRLVDVAGNETPLSLDESSYQTSGLALLDFSDASMTGCEGATGTNTVVTGTAAAGDYAGVRFTLGVPLEMNHGDPIASAGPLSVVDMAWAWEDGRKFVRMDGASLGNDAWRFHLGSRGCVGDPRAGGVTACDLPNRAEVSLSDYDSATDAIAFDIAALVRDVDLATFTADTPPGCMAGPGDPDCAGYFRALGLTHMGAAAGVQSVFSVQ